MSRQRTERVDVRRVTGPLPERIVDERADDLIVEEPLSIQLDGTLVSTTMRTPGHDAELAVGFCLTDGLLAGMPVIDVRHCGDVQAGESELNVITVDTGCLAPAPTPRLGNVSSSCGWCGSEQIDELCARLDPLPDSEGIDLDVIASVPGRVLETQELFATTGSVHAAAVFDRDGRVIFTREDVGRHNAVDKVVGALVRGADDGAGLPATGLGLFISGRASIEMVQKAWAGGFSTLVAVSAPTALAVDAARRANLVLAGFVRGDSFNLYSPA
ncbi:formate dehydrogenase accessory sulfurtransferase FdhD [Ilumatobacter nonamiensis]|uniref:formate dehydrogenase accessory sulfurtransferase FdhD n=1 Tax=Ilumatobacter nonamiensis TaxID=467093 RepID=UPI0003461C8C|nr:formate dehydrogenase accessory sulfurtransferase FdhD [Ilumatobacter nonamiensis]